MIENAFDLSGKNIVVTGGGTGLGYSIAEVLLAYGAKVMIAGRREEVLKKATEQLGPNCSYRVFDLGQLDKIPCFVKETEEQMGQVDTLINNAGIHLKKDLLDVTDAEFESVIRINQQSTFAMAREFSRKMIERQQGSIIMISSMAAKYGIPKVIAYTASKAAIEGMTRAMAVELSPHGIRINCIAPGFIETDMSGKALNNDPERKKRVLSKTPMGRLGKTEDVGFAALYLASDAAKYITGVVLPVDGGNSIGF
jgi:NAD(P)-dependent dehydrogenase (short-subunit alcohol dehydrogenase family)